MKEYNDKLLFLSNLKAVYAVKKNRDLGHYHLSNVVKNHNRKLKKSALRMIYSHFQK